MIIDNKKNRYSDNELNIVTVWDFIKTYSGKESEQVGKFDIVTGYFTIHTLSKLYEELPEKNKYRIISSEMVGDDYKKDIVVDLLSNDMDICNIGNIDKYAQQAIAFLERDTVEMRAEIPDFCHAKAYIFRNNNPTQTNFYITGSSNLTPAGIGLKPVPNVELNLAENCNSSNADYQELRTWYDDIWSKAKTHVPEDKSDKKSKKITVKEYFIRKIKEYFRTYTPEEIYYKILFELFNSELELEGGIEHTQDMNLLQTSVIWKTLFNYQQKGVISLIKMLRKYNGAILADAVGLGKTFSALAVIKYFQTQGYMTLLLCPKKLEYNWKQYLSGTGSRFEKDDFRYRVRFHTDLQDNRLNNNYGNDFNLDYLQSRQKLLIVIDESHNLRNEKSSRYQALLNDVIKSNSLENRDVKVLMLSATPINTGLSDVRSQFKLIAKDNDQAFDTPDFGVESLENTFRYAQKKYTEWAEINNRTIGGFIRMLPQKFFNLTDKLIVARTRNLIEKTLGEDLGFPQKNSPKNIYQGVEHFGSYKTTEEIYQAFERLAFTAYMPSYYIKKINITWQDDFYREQFLVKMMCVLLMKRLESSWFALMKTVEKIKDIHEKTLESVENYTKYGRDSCIRKGEGFEDDEMEYSTGGEIWVSDITDMKGFKSGLEEDCELLNEIYQNLLDFQDKYKQNKEHDAKLDELEKILQNKQDKPNKKVVVFTAYADTANFLYEELQKRGFERIAMVSGQKNLSSGKHKCPNFTEILQSFAPYSKLYKELDWENLYSEKLDHEQYYNDEKGRWKVSFSEWEKLVKEHKPNIAQLLDDGIDILIATDCLSEGQNLQDADMQINYDIHWNPVRLIQRFGRIDRIGSPNKTISCVNFWPAKSFDEYLNLEERIQNRMLMMNLVGSETIEVTQEYQNMVKDNTLIDKNAKRLLEELTKNSMSDIESVQTLSLKDFSFESYRQDLVDYYNKKSDFYRRMPNGVFSGFVNQSTNHTLPSDNLIALVGYPKRPEGKKEHVYTELYLVCHPMGEAPQWQEINKAEILELLRNNKNAPRYVPEWITQNDTERITKLSDTLKEWMNTQIKDSASSIMKDPREMLKTINTEKPKNLLLDKKYKIENFDLIVWEYVTRNNN